MGDLISRQAAIDALDKRFDDVPMEQTANILQLRRDLRELPSEQPEPSSVRENDADHIWYKGKQFISLTRVNGMLMEHQKYTDIISRQMAIEALEEHEKSEGHNYSMFQSVVSECAEVIRDLPSVQPDVPDICVGNMISRQAAIDIVDFECGEWRGLAKTIEQAIERLPSAQSEDCDTCKHGYFGDSQCENCRERYPSHYERRTDERTD